MKIFIDSSLLVEYEKQTNPDLLDDLIKSEHRLFINPIVASEYLYQLLGVLGGRSPMSICESGKIQDTLSSHDTTSFLSGFEILPIPDAAIIKAIDFMKKYNLLPNDAIILASCQLQNIGILASFDTDFQNACNAEGIRLVTELTDL